ncbi:uncharacterized protein LOC119724006 [Patiria miniata]|uniref:LRAT domain-containing protein n=1 Tax=Patiria miniata TaxID=46514 RepID=A0A913ZHI1_PATMI|nr:uncharacterized protein LOC119724006 [Patiria miniata]
MELPWVNTNFKPCAYHNKATFEGQPYYHGDQLLGVRCAGCGQEWLQERFLFQPNNDNTRHYVNVDNVVLKKQLKMEVESDPAFQVSGSRTMSKNFKFEGDSLKVGDHIAWHRPKGYWHHAIVSEVGNEVKVIQWARDKKARKMERKEDEIDLQNQEGPLFRIDYSDEVTKINPSELVIARARAMLYAPGKYHLLRDNCEAYASYCKTGFAQSCQVVWLTHVLKICASTMMAILSRCFCDASLVVLKECTEQLANLFSEGTVDISIEACQISFDGFYCVGAGVALLIEGIWCVYDLSKIYHKRANGEISRVDFVQRSIQRAVEALVKAGCIGGSVAGSFGGMAIGMLICPGIGTVAGFLIGGIVGGVVGGIFAGAVITPLGPWIARKFASCIGRDDRAVEIGDLQRGDHVVFYGFSLHPRHHAIVVDCDPVKGKVRVVHHTYKNGVVEEVLDFIPPVYRLLYDNDCAAPDEVIERARSKIGDETCKYSLAFNNCKTFARCCKESEESWLDVSFGTLDDSSDDNLCVREIRMSKA